jgi:16S rRNA G1207 methylase RsmC
MRQGGVEELSAHPRSFFKKIVLTPERVFSMAGTERQRELRRRRTRTKKTQALLAKAKKSNAATKAVIARKLRMLTPGADVIIAREGLI